MSTVQRPPVTIQEFMKMPDPPDGSKLELVRGEVVVMPPPKGRHGICCSKIGRLLGNFVQSGPITEMAQGFPEGRLAGLKRDLALGQGCRVSGQGHGGFSPRQAA